MIIVSNTSPLNYLILIGQINLLPALFQQITIPQAVYRCRCSRTCSSLDCNSP